MNQMNDCVFLERPVPARECLIRKIAARKRDENGHEGFDPCLHCDKVQTKGETMSKRATCIDCKADDSCIVAYDRCYKCLKAAREAGKVPPQVSRKDQKYLTSIGQKPANKVTVSTVKTVEKAAPVPPPVENPLPVMPIADMADLASYASSLAVVAQDLGMFAAELQAKAERLNKAVGFISEARKIMHKQLPR